MIKSETTPQKGEFLIIILFRKSLLHSCEFLYANTIYESMT